MENRAEAEQVKLCLSLDITGGDPQVTSAGVSIGAEVTSISGSGFKEFNKSNRIRPMPCFDLR
jgi:hypothetical protein